MTTAWEIEGDEPRDFLDDATGLQCALRRGPGGHWCGYVGLPEGHPLYSKDYDAPVIAPPGFLQREVKVGEDYGAIALFCGGASANPEQGIYPLDLLLRCHGGLTYSNKGLLARDNDDLWWLGFDCAHSGDLSPKYAERYPIGHERDVYRDEQYVRASLAKLCGDIAALSEFMREKQPA